MDSLIWSNVFDYQSFLDSLFEPFLVEHHISEITRKNYRSDLRHFFNWLTQTTFYSHKTFNKTAAITETFKSVLSLIRPELLDDYKRQLLLSHVPIATVNRRLSSLRVLFRFAESNGWISENPMIFIRNLKPDKSDKEETLDQTLAAWQTYLSYEGASKTTIRNYTNDISEFLTWVNQTN